MATSDRERDVQAAGVDEVLLEGELERRVPRGRDPGAEARHLARLVRELATSPAGLLQQVVESARLLCGAEAAGLGVLEPRVGTPRMIRWAALTGIVAHRLGTASPLEASPAGLVVTGEAPLLLDRPDRAFPDFTDPSSPFHEMLVVPWPFDGRSAGVLWVASRDPAWRFDAEDARLLVRLGWFAAAHRIVLPDVAEETTYGTLFRMMDEGLYVAEVLLDDEGTPCDFLVLHASGAHERITGFADVTGRRLSEIVPQVRPDSLAWLAEVLARGEPVSIERHASDRDRWFEATAARLGGEESRTVGIVFKDITARKQAELVLRESESRQAFLVRLADALRPIGEAEEIQATAARVLGEQLGAQRVVFAEVVDDAVFEVRRDWTDGLPSVVGRHPVMRFGPRITALRRRGADIAVEDTRTDPRLDDQLRAGALQFGIVSYAGVALVKDGRWVAALGVHGAAPRTWTPADFTLIHETAERTWAAVERARAETALRESETRFQALLHPWVQALWETGPDGRVMTDSPSWRATTGQAIEEWLGEGWAQAVHPEDRANALRTWQEATRDGVPVNTVLRVRTPDGEYRWTNVRATPLRHPDGSIRKWVGLNIDITERLLAAQALRESEARYRALFESIDEGYAVVELLAGDDGHPTDCRLLAVNPAFLRLTGLAEPIGRTAHELGLTLERHWLALAARVAESGAAERLEATSTSLGGRWFDVHVSPAGVPGSRRLGFVFQDTTARRHAEELLRDSEARQAFLLALGDALLPLNDPAEVQHEASRLLGERLDVHRVAFAELQGDEAVVGRGFTRGVTPLPERFPHAVFGRGLLASHRRGEPVVTEDVESDPRFGESERAAYRTVQVAAFIGVRLAKGPRGDVVLGVSSATPRRWTAAEVALVRDAGERAWDAVERARAEAALRASRSQLAFLDEVGELASRATSEAELVHTVGARIGARLGVVNCVFSEVDTARGEIVNLAGWQADGMPGILGRAFPIAEYLTPEFVASAGAAELVVVADTQHDARVHAAAYAAVQVGAFVAVPAFRGGRWRYLLSFGAARPRAWRQSELALLRELAARLIPRLERARAEAALRASEERFRALFTTMDQGFCILEKLPTAPGAPSDFRYVTANPAFTRHTGLQGVVGRRIRGVVPRIEPWIVDLYDDVVRTGQHRRLEGYLAHLGLWIEADAFPGQQPGHVAIVFSNVSARKRAELAMGEHAARQAYLVRLADALRPLSDPVAIQAEALRALGEQLDVTRALYGEVEPDGEHIHFARSYVAEGAAPLTGRFHMSDFGPTLVEALQAGRVIRLGDVATDPTLRPEEREAWLALGIRAAVGVPLVKAGRFVAKLSVHRAAPTPWTDAEVALIAETAERTWAALERAWAETALRESEARFRALHAASDDVVYRMSPDWRQMQQLDGRGFLTDARTVTADWVERYIPPDDRAAVWDAIQAAIARREPFELEHRVFRSDGSIGWTRSRAVPILDADGRIVEWFGTAADITEQREAEVRRAFLLELSDRLRFVTDPEQIQADAARLLGEHLGVMRCGYAEDVGDGEHFAVTRSHARDAPDLVGRYRYDEHGTAVRAALVEGRTTVLRDVAEEPLLSPAERAAFAAAGVGAALTVPLVKEGRLEAVLFVHEPAPRAWSPAEVSLAEAVAERTWDALERARAESRLRASQERLQRAISIDTVGILFFTLEGRIIEANRAFERLCGYPLAALRATTHWESLTAPEYLGVTTRAAEELATTGETIPYEKEMVRPDGTRWWGLFAPTRIRGSGRTAECVEFIVDITEAKAAEARVREGEERMHVLIESVTDYAIFTLDLEGRVTSWNDGARRLTGWAADEVLGAPLGRFYTPEDVAAGKPAAELRQAAEAGRAEDESWRVRKDGSRYWCNETVSPLRGADGVLLGYAKVSRDLTERKAMEDSLRHAREEAEQANRAKDEFLAMLGHELRNPLAPIVTALELMRLRGTKTPEQEILDRQVGHLTHLVDDLMDVSRIARGKIELQRRTMDLREVVSRALEQTAPLIEQRRNHVELQLPPEGLTVDVDRNRMAQVLSNLITNASKYSSTGSRIVLRGERHDRLVRITVQDEGIGIEREMLGAVFDPFVQQGQSLARTRGGLGLGLAIVRSLVTAHGGRVWADSAGTGHGSTFTLELPAGRARTRGVEETGIPRPQPSSHGPQRVLIVDDNADAALTLRVVLEQLGYVTEVAADGESAVARASVFDPAIVLLDIGLPDIDGYEVARRLRRMWQGKRNARVLAVTGYGQPADRERAREAGFDHHLVKPINVQQLRHLLEDNA